MESNVTSQTTGAAQPSRPPGVVVIMGVAGSGKTTVGRELARELGWSFRDADEFHPPANIAKMSAGIPLNDDDRQPWLRAIRAHIDAATAAHRGAVVTCSALKESYRQALLGEPASVGLVHLTGPFEVILQRMQERQGHFMRPEMLRSQFEALQPPRDALNLDVRKPVADLVVEIRRAFRL